MPAWIPYVYVKKYNIQINMNYEIINGILA